jgi:hypothetical protein
MIIINEWWSYIIYKIVIDLAPYIKVDIVSIVQNIGILVCE